MLDPTLSGLQQLKDAEFHKLCDELLPRISREYRPLVPHGRNNYGDSIVGQPDSYVGASAETCEIAIQYTCERKGWWSKVIADVRAARQFCTRAKEIVVALPRDVDREAPKRGNGTDWLKTATRAAAPAGLTVLNGRAIAQQLDDDHQDLRYYHLQIPFSRLSWRALLAGCGSSNRITIDRLETLGRFDAAHYLCRDSDDRLFRLWSRAAKTAIGRSEDRTKRLLIPIIADSGLGKTSLLARFAVNGSQHSPTVFFAARDISLDRSDALLQAVLGRLLGSMNPNVADTEEAHLVRVLAGKTPLTVVLDGLDESVSAEGVRLAIGGWLQSKLGQASILIVSSRPEFWRRCRDAVWSVSVASDDSWKEKPQTPSAAHNLAAVDPLRGMAMPEGFTDRELLQVWEVHGREPAELWKLSPEARRELQHPFTLKSAIELLGKGASTQELSSRAKIMKLWLQSRLRLEKNNELGISERIFTICLHELAKASARHGAWLSVDSLHDVPRFDPIHPPGQVVERLLAANILERHPIHTDQIRFTFDAVLDFFQAESIVQGIQANPTASAHEMGGLSLTSAVNQLDCIGLQIAGLECSEPFVSALAELDSEKAAIVILAALGKYSSECRTAVVRNLSNLLTSRFDANKASATELLGKMKCPESVLAVEQYWLSNPVRGRLHGIVSQAAISLGIVSLVPTVFETSWFLREAYHFDLRIKLSEVPAHFKLALVKYASSYLPAFEHNPGYQKAVTLLGYLGNEEAVDSIAFRTRESVPYHYESAYLMAIGTSRSLLVYSQLVDRYETLSTETLTTETQNQWSLGLVPHANLWHLATDSLETCISDLIRSSSSKKRSIGRRLAMSVRSDRLLELLVAYPNPKDLLYRRPQFGREVGAVKWIEMWKRYSDRHQKCSLIFLAADIPDARLEHILIEALYDADIADICADSLCRMGSELACGTIRQFLESQCQTAMQHRSGHNPMLDAVCGLRDSASIPTIVKLLESDHGEDLFEGPLGLAKIGSDRAERALLNLKNQSPASLVQALIYFGSHLCVEEAVKIAKTQTKGPEWLLSRCQHAFMSEGWQRHHFRTDIELAPLLDYVLGSALLTNDDYKSLLSLFHQVDSAVVRKLLREWYSRTDSADDFEVKGAMLSAQAFQCLCERGDRCVIRPFVEEQIQSVKKGRHLHHVIDNFSVFEREVVQIELRRRLVDESDDDSITVITTLVGNFGDESDAIDLGKYLASTSDALANSAFEAKLKLLDPLRLPPNW